MRKKTKFPDKRHSLLLLASCMMFGVSASGFAHVAPESKKGSISATQQQRHTVSGTVLDTDGMGLIGVNVVEKGTTNGVVTDIDGKYSINVGTDNPVLIFSLIGYSKQEVNVRGQRTVNIEMEEDDFLLEEVVVTAYGVTKRASFTGSATVVDNKKLETLQPANITQGLQGLSPGVQVINNSGRPGDDGTIVIRGLGSMTASSNPLYVIDGVPSDIPLSSLSYSDIESITVLKDAASAALYGSRAGNGVIMITTKKGKATKPTVNLRASWSTSDFAVKFPEKVSAAKQYELSFEALYNDATDFLSMNDADARQYAHDNVTSMYWLSQPFTDHTGQQRQYRSGWNTDYPVGLDGKIKPDAQRLWEENLFDQAFSYRPKQDYGIDISGGIGDKTNYFVSVSMLDDKGVHFSDHFKRFTGRASVNTELNKYVSLENSIMYTSSTNYNGGFGTRVFRVLPSEYSAYAWDHTTNQYAVDPYSGGKVLDEGWFNGRAWWPKWAAYGAKGESVKNWNDNVRTVSALNINFLPELTFKTTYSYQFANFYYNNWRSPVREGVLIPAEGSVTRTDYRNVSHTINNVLTFDKTFNKHHLNVLVGQEAYKYTTNAFNAYRKGLNLPTLTEISLASEDPTAWSYRDQYALVSFFSRVNYDYKDRYYLSASIRTDGSSRFQEDNRWGTFYSVGASWRITEEEFMTGTRTWLDNLKLKASYGEVGNDNVGYYPYMGLFETNSYNGGFGVTQKQLPNKDIQWETNIQTNIGVEFGLLSRLTGTFELFSRKSKNLLLNQPLAPSVGMESTIKNIGDIKNSGWEFELNYHAVNTKDFDWVVSLNASQFKNKITRLPSEKETFSVGVAQFIWKEGASRYDLYAPLWADVNPDNGRNRWWKHTFDANGNVTGREKTENYSEVNNEQQRMNIGSTLPDLYGSLTNTFRYRDFDLSLMLYYSLGGKVYDYNYGESSVMRENFAAYDILDKRWQKPGDVTSVAKIYARQIWNAYSQASYSDKYVFDNNFLRLRNLVVGYTIPKALTSKIGINMLRLYFKGDNLLTFGTLKNHGTDPENFSKVNDGKHVAGGVIDGESAIPTLRSYTFGLNIQF